MKVSVYYSKSGYNVINKKFEKIGSDIDNVEFIKPVNLVDPTLILSPSSRVVEGNYLYFDGFGTYNRIVSVTTEHNRMIVNCHRDPLSTYKNEILNLEKVILDRISRKGLPNYFLVDEEIDILSFPYIETHPLDLVSGTPFSMSTNSYILALTGGVTASSNNEGGE